jgi:hypothetical protein
LLLQFLRRFSNPLILILLAASLISALVQEVVSFVIITLMVLISVTLDFVQEYRAGKAAEKLRQLVQVRASVLRDGEARQVPLSEVVPGDVVLLSAGTLVPADGLLLTMRRTQSPFGLTSSAAAAQLTRDGYNELPSARPRSLERVACEVLREPPALKAAHIGTQRRA